MGNWSKVVVLLIILSIGIAFGGYMLYQSKYVKPRKEIEDKRAEIQGQIDQGRKTSEFWTQTCASLSSLYTRSFPTNRVEAGIEYQRWLSQMLEFCNVHDPKVTVGSYNHPRNSGLATQSFFVQGQFTLLDLTQFLYEFYWTPFLHRVSHMDVTPQEHSDFLQVSMTIEGLTILYKKDQNLPYPLVDKLPLSTAPERQLASGPFAAYRPMAEREIFRAVKTGVDSASYAMLTGLPVVTDDSGQATKIARWNMGAEGRTEAYKIGERMTVGAFDATIEDIDPDVGIVVLRQNNGTNRLWMVPLGYKLSEAVAIPNTLF